MAQTVPNECRQTLQFQALPGQMAWTQGEDELVAAGLMRYGLDMELISCNMLPVKTAKEIQTRQKNRCHRVEGNCIRVRSPISGLLLLLLFVLLVMIYLQCWVFMVLQLLLVLNTAIRQNWRYCKETAYSAMAGLRACLCHQQPYA